MSIFQKREQSFWIALFFEK